MIKYSSKGSLIDYFKTNKLANKLEVGILNSFQSFCIYGISIQLTELGLKRIKEVIQMTFNYINIIKSNGANSIIYNDIDEITSTQFKFMEKPSQPSYYLAFLSSLMLIYPSSQYFNLLKANILHDEFNSDLIQNYLNMINTFNSLIIIGTNTYPNNINSLFSNNTIVENKTEKWYNTTYINGKLEHKYQILLNNSLIKGETFSLRGKNDFITKENEIVSCYGKVIIENKENKNLSENCDEQLSSTPEIIIDSENLKVWHKVNINYLKIA